VCEQALKSFLVEIYLKKEKLAGNFRKFNGFSKFLEKFRLWILWKFRCDGAE
jgi:hypothetical protein